MSGEIPEADYYEAVFLTCPYRGCSWGMPYSWYEMENKRPAEYLAHYRAVHIDGPMRSDG